jgi:hypothetical protein
LTAKTQKTGESSTFGHALAGPEVAELSLDYFAAGGAGVDGVVAVLLAAFLFFFTCFFATGALLSAGAAGVCAASDNPAAASVRDNPSNTDVIFFMMFIRFLFVRRSVFRLCIY